jgi:Ca-activated chloride channel family protein
MIEQKAKSGIFLSVLGVGYDNLKDGTIVKLADHGNGNYAYLDSLNEAKKVLIDQMSGTLVTVAKDVKIQVEFNPAKVSNYRLIGYEKRALRAEDFNDDKKDAGEIGAGHTVTALYEIAPAGAGPAAPPAVDPLKYQPAPATSVPAVPGPISDELLTVKLRYKEPTGDTSRLQEFPVIDRGRSYLQASEDFKFAASVAEFGMVLRQSPYKGSATMAAAGMLVEESMGDDPNGYRHEFFELVSRARVLGK